MDEPTTLPPFEFIDGPTTPIERIIQWQKDIGADQPDDVMAIKHVGYVLEEVIEAMELILRSHCDDEPFEIGVDYELTAARDFLKEVDDDFSYKNKESMADAFTDALVFCIGGLMRLGLDPNKCIDTVATSLDSKRLPDGTFARDAYGKIKKPATFVEPDWSWMIDNRQD